MKKTLFLISIKKRCYALFSLFVILTCIYLNCQGHEVNNVNKLSAEYSSVSDEYFNKCSDKSTTIIEIKKTYKKLRKIYKLYRKALILSDKKDFEDFKKDKYYKGLSKEQQKDINVAYKAFMKSKKKWFRIEKATIYTSYQFNKIKRNCYNKKAEADRKVEKAKKRYVSVNKTHCIVLKEAYEAWKVFCGKKGIIRDKSKDKLIEETFISLENHSI
jgi:hypothetical protein